MKTNIVMIKFRDMPLKRKLFLCILVFIVFPLIIMAFIINNYFITQNINDNIQTDLQILKQTNQSFVRLLDEVDNLSVRILSNDDIQTLISFDKDSNNSDYTDNMININRWLYRELYFSDDIDAINISTNNDYFQIGNTLDMSIDKDQVRKLIAIKKMDFWTDSYKAKLIYSDMKTNVVSFYRDINDMNVLGKRLAVEEITVKEEMLLQLYSKLNTFKGGEIYLVSADGTILSSTDRTKIGTELSNSITTEGSYKTDNGYFKDMSAGRNNIVLYYTISKVGWKLVQTIPRKYILPLTTAINATIFIAIFSCMLFGILFSVVQNKVILSPLRLMLNEMQKLRKGDFKVQLTTKSNDEIGQIIREYTEIINQFNELVNKVYISRMKQREAELLALETQVNPHFLYNTLDSIRWLALKDKNYKVSEQLEALSEMYRHVLHNGKEIVTIKEELESVQNYMVLQHAKYGERIKLSINADGSLYDCLMPKIILQPLVGNSVLHGIEPKIEGGRIEVEIKQEDNNIRIIVSDNGVGVNGETIQAMIENKELSSKVFALKNIDERIKIQYGDGYGLSFYGKEGEGVIVKILIPLRRNDGGGLI